VNDGAAEETRRRKLKRGGRKERKREKKDQRHHTTPSHSSPLLDIIYRLGKSERLTAGMGVAIDGLVRFLDFYCL
jgi:hypothetical protein